MELINTWLTPNTIFGIAVIFAGVAVTVAYYLAARRRHYWHKTNLPTLQQYITQHPNCKTYRGIQCLECNSGSIRNLGLDNASDPRRVFRCNHCNTLLYRNEDWK